MSANSVPRRGDSGKQDVYTELDQMNCEMFIEHKMGLPADVLRDVARYYRIVQAAGTYRGVIKRQALAALLDAVLQRRDVYWSRGSIATFLGIHGGGFSRGLAALRGLDHPEINALISADDSQAGPRVQAVVRTAYAKLAPGTPPSPRLEALVGAAVGVCDRAESLGVGTNSTVTTQALGAAYLVYARAHHPPTKKQIEAAWGTRLATLRVFIDAVESRWPHFCDIYRSHGLAERPLVERTASAFDRMRSKTASAVPASASAVRLADPSPGLAGGAAGAPAGRGLM
jgi:hypothetical protein